MPPLSALYVFEVVSRHLNMVRAAEELGRTQSALSKQILALETFLGVPLFERTPRGLRFTEAGDTLRLHCQAAFGELHQGLVSLLGVQGRQSLRLAVARSYATRVLSHRIGDFLTLYPGIDVVLDGHRHLVELATGEVDAAIRVGDGKWTDVVSERIEDDPLFPVAAASLVKQCGTTDIEALMDLTNLIHFTERPYWQIWSAGADVQMPRRPRAISVSESVMAVEAAEAGQGITIARRSLVRDAIADGRLVKLSAIEVNDGVAYFFCTAPGTRKHAVSNFRDWLFARLTEGHPQQ